MIYIPNMDRENWNQQTKKYNIIERTIFGIGKKNNYEAQKVEE